MHWKSILESGVGRAPRVHLLFLLKLIVFSEGINSMHWILGRVELSNAPCHFYGLTTTATKTKKAIVNYCYGRPGAFACCLHVAGLRWQRRHNNNNNNGLVGFLSRISCSRWIQIGYTIRLDETPALLAADFLDGGNFNWYKNREMCEYNYNK